MERPSRVTFEPSSNIGMLMGGVVVDDGVDRLSTRNLFLDDIEETDELPDGDGAACCGRSPCRRECSFAANKVVVPCRSPSCVEWFRRDPSSAAVRAGCGVKRLNLALFVDRQDDGVCGRDRHRARRRRAICRRSAGRWGARTGASGAVYGNHGCARYVEPNSH